ncbi:MAG: NADH-quinone oxidoreductase subunit J, partial [Actinomycetia bacterium]|nr:NADH-quinone oxidoreductase subunit J [Actinomycetes bacterium]
TGAIMILFLFVIMLVGRDASDSLRETLRGQRLVAALFGLAFVIGVGVGVGRAFTEVDPVNLDTANADGQNVNSIANLLFTKYLFAFELTSALLIVAAIGAMVLTHVERDGPKPTQRALARARIRSGRPQPLPGPGVLASGDAIGTPALLPDGSVTPKSVFASLAGAEPPTRQGRLPAAAEPTAPPIEPAEPMVEPDEPAEPMAEPDEPAVESKEDQEAE